MRPISMGPVRFGNQTNQPKKWHKLDARGRYELEQGKLKGKIQVLIRLDLDKQGSQTETLKKLEEAGFKPFFSAGHQIGGIHVSSGAIDVDQLQQLHDLDMVKQIEVSRPLHQEGSGIRPSHTFEVHPNKPNRD